MLYDERHPPLHTHGDERELQPLAVPWAHNQVHMQHTAGCHLQSLRRQGHQPYIAPHLRKQSAEGRHDRLWATPQ